LQNEDVIASEAKQSNG